MRWCGYILLVAWMSQLLYLWPLPPSQADSLVSALDMSIDGLAESTPENGALGQAREEILTEAKDARSKISSNSGELEDDLWLWWFLHLTIIMVGVLFAVLCLYRKWYAVLGTIVATYLFIDIISEPWLLWQGSRSFSSFLSTLWALATPAGAHVLYVSFLLPLFLVALSIVLMYFAISERKLPDESGVR